MKPSQGKDETHNPANRDIGIDLLRALGLPCIVLAHVSPPTWLNRIRVFDVVLMVFVNGCSFALSWKGIGFAEHLRKRFIRLVVPTWGFLCLFFVIAFILRRLLPDSRIPIYGYDRILRSFFMANAGGQGIGYVWIFRVFFLMSLIAPCAVSLSKRIGHLKLLSAWSALLLLSHCCAYKSVELHGILGYIVHDCAVYTIGYGWACALGICWKKLGNKAKILVFSFVALVFLAFAIYYRFDSFHNFRYKYPPSPYYLSYGILVSVILYELVHRIPAAIDFAELAPVSWLSRHSLEVYLWHILPLYLLSWRIIPTPDTCGARFCLVLTTGILLTFLQHGATYSVKSLIARLKT